MSDISDLQIRLYEPGDDEGIVGLLKKTFPKWAAFSDPLGLWRWKYIDTPQRSVIIVAVLDDDVVGCNHSIIYNAKLGPHSSSLRYDDDTAVDSEYRSLGVWSKILDYKTKLGLLEMYGYYTTINPIIIKQGKRKKWNSFPFNVTRMVKTRDIDLHLRMTPMKNVLLVKLGYLFLKTMNRVNNVFRSPINRIDEFEVTQVSEFDERVDSFWEKIKDNYQFIIEKKHKYLNWRFTDNDRGSHLMIQAAKEDEVLGYTVIGFKEGSAEGQIEELLALRDREDVAYALLDFGCNCLDELGVNTVYYQVVEGHPYQGLSGRRGFVDSRSKPNIQSTSVEGSEEDQFLKDAMPGQVYFNYAETV